VRLILGHAADAYEDDDNDIGDEVAERMDGISHHSRTMSHDACDEFEYQQYHIRHSAYQRHLIYFFVSVHLGCFIAAKVHHFSEKSYEKLKISFFFALN
jgi:hypothetical protein